MLVKKYYILYFTILITGFLYFHCLPRHLFPGIYATVVFDAQNNLIGSRVAADGQWRFPDDSIVPEKFKKTLICFEDQHFYYHTGFNIFSLLRAMRQNIQNGKVLSGGSTITMQVIRLYRKNKHRTIFEKVIEIFLSDRLEIQYSKDQILSFYASNAPFGANVVGINAAAWRYFGRNSQNLSWAESALLAVLPNAPSMIHPGKNRQSLIHKRNHLLKKLLLNGIITQEVYSLSLLEIIPEKPLPFPDLVPHMTSNFKNLRRPYSFHSSIQKSLQENILRIVGNYYSQLKINNIQNAAVVVIDVKLGNPLAYIGNIPEAYGNVDGQQVDCVQATRSTGSILKPFLFAVMQQEGLLLPGTLVADIPTRIAGFKPENYDAGYDGAVPARKALARSLNIPAVRMLQEYGIPKFQNILQHLGMTTLVYNPDHYGLTLIVGGAEGKLWEICSMYRLLAKILNDYGKVNTGATPGNRLERNSGLSPGSIYLTLEALLEVNRPDEESGWANLSSSRKIAWKTGTSYGFRDGWAVGTTPEYIVGVWIGNADGEGKPGITGIGAAAPLMFRVFNALPATSWFKKPNDDLDKIPVCRLSGYKAGPFCDFTDTIDIARAGNKTGFCPFHQLVHLTKDNRFRVNSQCVEMNKVKESHWFVLPPAMELYYKKRNIFYQSLPPIKAGCTDNETSFMELIYPTEVLKIYVPHEMDGSLGKTIFEMAHRNAEATLYWHVDNEFLGSTHGIHQLAFTPGPGKHLLTVVDQDGHTIKRWFEVVERKR